MAHGEGGRVKVTCCQPFGTYCISGGADKQLLVWDLITGSCIKVRAWQPATSARSIKLSVKT